MINKSNTVKEFDNISKNHSISGLNREDFHQFINGLYQAEGTLGVYFVKIDSLKVKFLFSIGQNYSPEALDVLLSLQKILNVGVVKLEFNSKNQPHIRYYVSNTKEIIYKTLPYFSLLYGQKRRDMAIIKKKYIYILSLHNLNDSINNFIYINEFIHLVYSINPEGNKRKVSLAEKLKIFNCSLNYNILYINENNDLPSNLFIIGLFLGDGSLGFVFYSPPSRLPRF
jgi:hypothetical protein